MNGRIFCNRRPHYLSLNLRSVYTHENLNNGLLELNYLLFRHLYILILKLRKCRFDVQTVKNTFKNINV